MQKNLRGANSGKTLPVPAGLYEMVCNASKMGLYIYRLENRRNADGLRLIKVNPAGEAIVGIKAAGMKGRSINNIFPDLVKRGLLKKYVDVARSGRGFKIDEFFHESKGRPGAWYLCNVFPLPDACLGMLLEDITLLKKTQDNFSTVALKLENIINTIGSPIFVKDHKHRWIMLNDAYCTFMGQPRARLLGKSDYDFFPKEQAEIFWKKDELVFKGRRVNTNEELFTDSAGKVHTIVTTKRVFRDADSNDILVGVIHDLTELEKANASLKLFRALMENSNDALYVVDPKDGSFLDFNQTACRRLGYSRRALLRMRIFEVQVKIADSKEWEAFVKKARVKGSILFTGGHKRRDGSVFPVEVNVTFVRVGEREFLLSAARDISERLKLEDATRELKTLQGLVPICARCKNIRNDKGYREQVETYIEKRSDARFTHGICEKCAKELYGKEDWFKSSKKK
ncbi:MAG: PAS domain S-box protein [Elusimicrobiota bacterium]